MFSKETAVQNINSICLKCSNLTNPSNPNPNSNRNPNLNPNTTENRFLSNVFIYIH